MQGIYYEKHRWEKMGQELRDWGPSDNEADLTLREGEKEGVLGGRVLDCSVVLRKVWQGHWGLSQSGPSEEYHLSWKKACPKIPAGLSVARTSPGEGRPGSEGWWISELSTWAADELHFSQLEIWKAQSHGHYALMATYADEKGGFYNPKGRKKN